MSRRLVLGALALLLAAGSVFLLLSPAGLALVWHQARPYLPPGIGAGEVSGRLVGPIRIRDLTLRAGDHRLEVARARLDWRPLELLGGDLVFDYIRAEGVRYAELPAEPAPAASAEEALPDWAPPLPIHVRDLDLRAITARSPALDRPLALDRLRGRVGAGGEGLYARGLRVRSALLEATADVTLEPRGPYPLRAAADWTLRPPGRPDLSGHTRLEGALGEDLELVHHMAPPLPLRVEARIRSPLDAPRWHLTAGAEDLDLAALGQGLPPVRGGFRLEADGDADGARGNLTFQGRRAGVGPFHGAADWAADLPGQTLTLRRAEVRAGDFPGRITARGEIARAEGDLRLDLTGEWADLRWPPAGAPGFRSPEGRWRLAGSPADLHATLDGRINDRGEVHAALTHRPDGLGAALRWRQVRWPDPALPLRSAAGELTLDGLPGAYRFRLDAALAHGRGPGGRIAAHGRGDLAGLAIEDLRAAVMDGTIAGSADVAWHPGLRMELDLQAAGVDPGTWFPRWPGRLDGRLAARGALTPGGPALDIAGLTVTGRLRDRDVALRGGGSYRPGRLEVAHLDLTAGRTTASLSGHLGDTLDLAWTLDSPDLADLHPDGAGRLEGSGRLEGAPRRPRVRATVAGKGLAFAGQEIGRLALAADVDSTGGKASRLRLAVDAARLAGRSVAQVRLTGSGRPQDHRLRAEAVSELGRAEAELTGSWHPGSARWDFRLARARLAPAMLPETWTLAGPAQGSLAPGRFVLEEACLTASEPRLCAAVDRRGEGGSGRFRAEALPLGYLLPLLPPGTGLEGELGGSGEVAWSRDGPVTGRAELTTGAGRLLHLAEGDPPREVIGFRPSRLTLSATPEAIEAETEFHLGREDVLRARARTTQGPRPLAEWPLRGWIRGRITDLGFLPQFLPHIGKLEGSAEADLELDGTLGSPGWKGRLRVAAARVELPAPGITLRDLTLSAEPGSGGTLALSGRAGSGNGELRLEGTARLGAGERWLQGRLWGKDFLTHDTLQARVWISPELALSLRGRDLEVTGEIRVPRAAITLKDFPGRGGVAVSRDQVIVTAGEDEGAGAAPWRLTSRIRLVLGDRVTFKGFGLTSRIAGDLTLTDEPGRPTTASGELRTEEGEYRAYGQRLTIETGKLLFGGGPITDPGLDVRAVRRPRPEVLVGVRAYGPLRNPRFELFSEPAMGETEQLAWLVLGRPLEEASGGEQAALSRAAVVLGMHGGGKLAEAVGEDLGLDEVTLETRPGETGDQAALVLGKYLSPRLYVSYGIGLFESVSALRMQYTLTRHWELVTESSATQTGGDLFYTIETGG